MAAAMAGNSAVAWRRRLASMARQAKRRQLTAAISGGSVASAWRRRQHHGVPKENAGIMAALGSGWQRQHGIAAYGARWRVKSGSVSVENGMARQQAATAWRHGGSNGRKAAYIFSFF